MADMKSVEDGVKRLVRIFRPRTTVEQLRFFVGEYHRALEEFTGEEVGAAVDSLMKTHTGFLPAPAHVRGAILDARAAEKRPDRLSPAEIEWLREKHRKETEELMKGSRFGPNDAEAAKKYLAEKFGTLQHKKCV